MNDITRTYAEKDQATEKGYNDALNGITFMQGSKGYDADLIEFYQTGWIRGRVHLNGAQLKN